MRVPITLVMSVLKADKMDDVVRDAVMLGVIAIQPVISERAEMRMATLVKSERVARWQRIAVSSAKQCGRAVVPTVAEALTLDDYLANWGTPRLALPGHRCCVRLMCVEPGADALDSAAGARCGEADDGSFDSWTRGRLVAAELGPPHGLRRYPDVVGRPNASRRRRPDRRVDGATYDLE